MYVARQNRPLFLFEQGNEMRNVILVITLIVLISVPAIADLEKDKGEIRQAALDYIEGWYEGDAERMERSLHPDLAKRIIHNNDEGRSRLDQMSALTLVQGARAGWGSRTPVEQRVKQVEILDVYENISSVKVIAKDWVDYLHVGRFNGRWVIVNVLWELTPAARTEDRK